MNEISREGPRATVDLNGLSLLVEWEGPHTVNSYTEEGQPVGTCSIGDYADNKATEQDFIEALDELVSDPDGHPLVTG